MGVVLVCVVWGGKPLRLRLNMKLLHYKYLTTANILYISIIKLVYVYMYVYKYIIVT